MDERIVRKFRTVAESVGMILNQAMRRFLEELTGSHSVERDIAELLELSARSGGHSHGCRFDRDDAHERS